MKNIVVPCDFSKPAINAFRFALDIAQKSGGTIYLLHSIELPVLYDGALLPATYIESDLYQDLTENAKKQAQRIIGKFSSEGEGIKVVIEVSYGSLQTSIAESVKEHAADLIVMGTNGARGVKEFLIGSNAEKVVRTSSVPVIAIKENFKGPIKNIVFPNLLETENQEDLLSKIKSLQNFFKAHLHIVWINTPLNFTNDSVTYERLEAFAKRFMLKNYSVHIYNYADGEEGIIHFADQIDADMIALGTHGRRGLAHLFSGSLAEDIVNHSKYVIWTSVVKKDEVVIVK